MKIAVLGAGIVGLAATHSLIDDGHQVTLIDREGPAAGASRGNAGWIAHTDIDPIASPKMLRQVPKFLMDPLGPLTIRRDYFFTILPWLVRLIAASRPNKLEASIEALIALQSLAMPAWERLATRLLLTDKIHKRGTIFAFDNHAAYGRALPHFKRQEAAGIAINYLDREDVQALEPGLADSIIAAAHFPAAAHVSDPAEITKALYDAARRRNIEHVHGKVIALEPDAKGVTIRIDGREPVWADRVVIALGAWSKPVAATVGDKVPLDTERGYNVSFPNVAGSLRHPVTFQGHGFVASPLDSGLRIGGAVEFAGLAAPPNHQRTNVMYQKATRFIRDMPRFESGTLWMGFRPSIPDSLPVIGPSKKSPFVIHAFGHGHYGLTQSVATGRIVTDLIAGRAPPIDLAPFSAQRF